MVYKDPFSDLLGFEVLAANGGGVKVRCVVKPEYTNAAGTAHGGLLYTLADVAFALAVGDGRRPAGRRGQRLLRRSARQALQHPCRTGVREVYEASNLA
jgi:hypothetical protein